MKFMYLYPVRDVGRMSDWNV